MNCMRSDLTGILLICSSSILVHLGLQPECANLGMSVLSQRGVGPKVSIYKGSLLQQKPNPEARVAVLHTVACVPNRDFETWIADAVGNKLQSNASFGFILFGPKWMVIPVAISIPFVTAPLKHSFSFWFFSWPANHCVFGILRNTKIRTSGVPFECILSKPVMWLNAFFNKNMVGKIIMRKRPSRMLSKWFHGFFCHFLPRSYKYMFQFYLYWK